MKRSVKFPIRLKVMISLLFGITAVVSAITFTMAHFFHEDKRSYINDWVSVATRTTAMPSAIGVVVAGGREALGHHRQLEGAGDPHHIDMAVVNACLEGGLDRSVAQALGDQLIETRDHDGHASSAPVRRSLDHWHRLTSLAAVFRSRSEWNSTRLRPASLARACDPCGLAWRRGSGCCARSPPSPAARVPRRAGRSRPSPRPADVPCPRVP